MEFNKIHVIRLLGVNIAVQSSNSDHHDVINTSSKGDKAAPLFSQESDGEDPSVLTLRLSVTPDHDMGTASEGRKATPLLSQESDGKSSQVTQQLTLPCGGGNCSTSRTEEDRLALTLGFPPSMDNLNSEYGLPLSPMPLRFLPPNPLHFHYHVGEVTATNKGKESSKRGGKEVCSTDDNQEPKPKKIRKISTINSHITQEPNPDIEQVPELLNFIQLQNGSQPVFLYRKRLQESDTKQSQNRIFLTKSDDMVGFLTEEEKNNASSKQGLKLDVVDRRGKTYNLHLGPWESLKVLVFKFQWYKLVSDNNARAGYWVEIWGYRVNEKTHLAVNFRKPNEQLSSSASTWSEGQWGFVNPLAEINIDEIQPDCLMFHFDLSLLWFPYLHILPFQDCIRIAQGHRAHEPLWISPFFMLIRR